MKKYFFLSLGLMAAFNNYARGSDMRKNKYIIIKEEEAKKIMDYLPENLKKTFDPFFSKIVETEEKIYTNLVENFGKSESIYENKCFDDEKKMMPILENDDFSSEYFEKEEVKNEEVSFLFEKTKGIIQSSIKANEDDKDNFVNKFFDIYSSLSDLFLDFLSMDLFLAYHPEMNEFLLPKIIHKSRFCCFMVKASIEYILIPKAILDSTNSLDEDDFVDKYFNFYNTSFEGDSDDDMGITNIDMRKTNIHISISNSQPQENIKLIEEFCRDNIFFQNKGLCKQSSCGGSLTSSQMSASTITESLDGEYDEQMQIFSNEQNRQSDDNHSNANFKADADMEDEGVESLKNKNHTNNE